MHQQTRFTYLEKKQTGFSAVGAGNRPRTVPQALLVGAPETGFFFSEVVMSADTSLTPLDAIDTFAANLCKLKALQTLLSSDRIRDGLDNDVASGLTFLFEDVFDSLIELQQYFEQQL